MEIKGIGIDLITRDRMARFIKSHNERLHDVFGSEELIYCKNKKDYIQCLAARWAVKECIIKAVGNYFNILNIDLTKIEITHSNGNKPKVILKDEIRTFIEQMGVDEIFVSISHTKEYIIGQVILVKNN